MRKAYIPALCCVAALALASGARAQMRGGHVGGSTGGARVVQTAPAVRSQASSGSRVVVISNNGGSQFASSFSTIGVPGLGFDYVHLAAVTPHHSTTGFFPVRFPNLRHGGRGMGSFVSFGIPFYSMESPVIVLEQPAPQVIVVPQAVPAADPERVERAPASREAPAAEPAAPVPDLNQILLVRRDGQVLRAVAFSAQGERIVYITPEGLRRTVPLAELDPVETERVNEEQGTVVKLK